MSIGRTHRRNLISETGEFEVSLESLIIIRSNGYRIVDRLLPVGLRDHLELHHLRFGQSFAYPNIESVSELLGLITAFKHASWRIHSLGIHLDIQLAGGQEILAISLGAWVVGTNEIKGLTYIDRAYLIIHPNDLILAGHIVFIRPRDGGSRRIVIGSLELVDIPIGLEI